MKFRDRETTNLSVVAELKKFLVCSFSSSVFLRRRWYFAVPSASKT